MTEKEKIHYLAVLVELRLFPLIELIRKSNIENKEKQIKETIENFTQELPQYLSEISDVENKVNNILQKTKEYDEELKKVGEKHNSKKEIGRDEEK